MVWNSRGTESQIPGKAVASFWPHWLGWVLKDQKGSQLPEEGGRAEAAVLQYLGDHAAGPRPLPLPVGVGGSPAADELPGHPVGCAQPICPSTPITPTWCPCPTPRFPLALLISRPHTGHAWREAGAGLALLPGILSWGVHVRLLSWIRSGAQHRGWLRGSSQGVQGGLGWPRL